MPSARRAFTFSGMALACSIAAALNLGSSSGGYYIVSAGNVPAEEIKANPLLASVVDIRARAIYPMNGDPSLKSSEETHLPLNGGPGSCPVGFLLRRRSEADVYRWRPEMGRFEKTGHVAGLSDSTRALTVTSCRILISEELFKSGAASMTPLGHRWALYSPDGARKLWSTEAPPFDSSVWPFGTPFGPLERPGGKILHGNYVLELESGRLEKLVNKLPAGVSKMWVWADNEGKRVALASGDEGRVVQSSDGTTWSRVSVPKELSKYLSDDIVLRAPDFFFDPFDANHVEIWTTPDVPLPPGVTGRGPFVVFRTRDGGSKWDKFSVERDEFLEPPVPGPDGTRLQFSTRQASNGSIAVRIWRPGGGYEDLSMTSMYGREGPARRRLVPRNAGKDIDLDSYFKAWMEQLD